MKKIKAIVFAMVAVVAFSALAATAFAETTLLAEWLLNGSAVTELTSTTTTGGLTLEDTKTLAGNAAVLCSGTVDGLVGANGEDQALEILNALGVAVAALGGLALLGTGASSGEGSECVTVKACAAGSTASPIEVWPVGLPWHTLLYLMENGEFLNLVTTEVETTVGSEKGLFVGYELLCLVLSLNVEDTCYSTNFDVPVGNTGAGGNAAVPAGAETTPAALCTQSKEETGFNRTDALTEVLPLSGGPLTVSSE